jgi:hypothetical protein
LEKSHLDIILKHDLVVLENIQQITTMEILIELLKSKFGSPVYYSALARDLECSDKSLKRWLTILENLYIIFKVLPFQNKIARSITGTTAIGGIMRKEAQTTKDTALFWPANAPNDPPSPWQSTNLALARLLKYHRQALGKAVRLAGDIGNGIDTLAPLMEALCRRTCRFCPEPCCITLTVWIDFRDLLLLHLLKKPIPARQAATEPGQACPYLARRGCRLPPCIRPWMCTQYLCSTLVAVLGQTGGTDTAALSVSIEHIERQRFAMEAEVIRQIKRKRRTSPSSSSACSG